MKYWWVNSKDTYEDTFKEGFIWAPKKDKGDKLPHHWKTMYDIREGDVIFCYSKGFIKAFGTVTKSSYDFPNPFYNEDENNEWEKEGNRVDLEIQELDTPIAKHLFNIRLHTLQEPTYSPINKDYNVNQGYLYYLNELSAKLINSTINKINYTEQNLKRCITEIKHKTSIIKSINEYNLLGSRAFLNKYGFSEATEYLLYHKNRLYDSKAIVGVAYQYEYIGEEYLNNDEFSGGKKTVVELLKNFNFEIINKKIIVSRAYFALKQLGKESTVSEIVDIIKKNKWYDFGTNDIEDVTKKAIERYCEGINRNQKHNRKLFRKIDSKEYPKKYSLIEFLEIDIESDDDFNDNNSEYESGKEGEKKKVYTTKYERDPKLRIAAKNKHGVTCFACGFNFEETYGEYAKDYIHIHHIKPLSESAGRKNINTLIDDLVPVCANCHSVIHRRKSQTKTIGEIKHMIENQKLSRC